MIYKKYRKKIICDFAAYKLVGFPTLTRTMMEIVIFWKSWRTSKADKKLFLLC